MRDEVRTTVKKKADEESHVRPNKIIRSLERENRRSDVLGQKNYKLLQNAAYYHRRKKLRTLPATLDNAVRRLENMADTIFHKNEKFLFHA